MDNIREELIRELKKAEIVSYGDFTLKSGKKSNFYVDLKKVFGNPRILSLICENLYNSLTLLDERPNVIAASGYGGIPIATLLSVKTGLHLTLVREKTKDHGENLVIEGYIPKKEDKIIIIDDVFSAGTSINNTIDGLKGTQAKILGAIVVLNREEAKANFPLKCLISLNELVEDENKY
ncbi:MAG: orotate phosphoribosyltransferase [Nanoarchaeota archaeon]